MPCGLDIPTEKWLNNLQTVETLIRRRDLGLYCLHNTLLGVSRLKWVKVKSAKCRWNSKYIFVANHVSKYLVG